jgi:hypothetical protein
MKEKKIIIIAMTQEEEVEQEMMINMMTMTVTTKCTKVKMTSNIKTKYRGEDGEETSRRKV